MERTRRQIADTIGQCGTTPWDERRDERMAKLLGWIRAYGIIAGVLALALLLAALALFARR
jgi:hypothetical protein